MNSLLVGKYIDDEYGCFLLCPQWSSIRVRRARKLYEFGNWKLLSDHLYTIVGVSLSHNLVVKIEFMRCKSKKNSLSEEYNFLRILNQCTPKTSPVVYSYKELSLDATHLLRESLGASCVNKNSANVLIMEKINPYYASDVNLLWEIVLLQKEFGIYHGDIKPANTGIDSSGNIILIDYDQAVFLTPSQINMKKNKFFAWTCELDKQLYPKGKSGWLRHYKRSGPIDFGTS